MKRPLRRAACLSRLLFFLTFFAVGLAPRIAALRAQDAPPRAETAPPNPSSGVSIAWADELRELGDMVARISPPPGRIDLLVNNMSSLSTEEVAAIDQWLRGNLGSRHFRLVDGEPVSAYVNVTLSEGVQGYVLVAQIRHGTDEQVGIFPVDKDGAAGKRVGGVALEDQLIWEQPGRILDFAAPAPATGEPPAMVILEVGQIVLYTRNQSQWQMTGSTIIPPMRPWLRAPRGHVGLSGGLANGTAQLSGVECKGDFTHLSTVNCNFVSQEGAPWTSQDDWKSKHLDSAGDATPLSLVCGGRAVALATGSGDWTQTDVIQGYEIGAVKTQGAMASGNPLKFNGPVTALWSDSADGVARAVVQNLQTGNYEAHLVTATCSQ